MRAEKRKSKLHIDYDFFSKVVSKYLLEFLLTLSSIRLLSYIVKSKLFLATLYVYHKLKLPFFLQLNGRVTNHVFFNALHQLKIKVFLKYVLNKQYRDDISLVTDDLYEKIMSNINDNLIQVMLFSSRKTFVNILIKNIQNIRMQHGEQIRTLAHERRLSPKFAWDYLLYMDFILQFLLSRVKDLQKDNENNYEVYVKYLFIQSDWLTILMDEIPGISRARLKGTLFSNRSV